MLKRTVQRRSEKEMTQFEKFVTDGNEKADELAKEGAMLDEGFMAQTRAKKKTVQQEREEVSHSRAVCSQLSLLSGGMERLKNSSCCQSKVDFCGQEWKQGIEWSGVLLPTSIDA